jgi:hypothetical protein
MTALDLIDQCHAAGIGLVVDGDGLTFEAPATVTVPVADLRIFKAEIVAILAGAWATAAMTWAARQAGDDLDALEALVFSFDERVAVAELDGGLDPAAAARVAYLAVAGGGQ